MKKEKLKFGFLSQSYTAPRAESFAMRNEGLLCSSPTSIEGDPEEFIIGNGSWEG